MTVDFDTDQCILVHYTGGSGGKFLINCLGLSKDCLLQDNKLLELSSAEKFNLLIERLNQTKNNWTDLNLGGGTLLGMPRPMLWTLKYFPKFDYLFQGNCIKDIINTKKFFFLATYDQQEIILTKNLIWPNARIINLVNPEEFICKYRKNTFGIGDTTLISFENTWNEIKGVDWPKFPKTYQDVENLSADIHQEFIDFLGDRKYNLFCQYIKTNDEYNQLLKDSIIWDVSWYFDEEKTVEELENLYQTLELDDFNEEYIRQYYQQWIQTLDRLK